MVYVPRFVVGMAKTTRCVDASHMRKLLIQLSILVWCAIPALAAHAHSGNAADTRTARGCGECLPEAERDRIEKELVESVLSSSGHATAAVSTDAAVHVTVT